MRITYEKWHNIAGTKKNNVKIVELNNIFLFIGCAVLKYSGVTIVQ